MKLESQPPADVSSELLEAIRSFPPRREVEHCGQKLMAPPFDFYTICPSCGTRIKLRSFSAAPEIEDVFDAVFAWMNQPETRDVAERRREHIEADQDD